MRDAKTGVHKNKLQRRITEILVDFLRNSSLTQFFTIMINRIAGCIPSFPTVLLPIYVRNIAMKSGTFLKIQTTSHI